MFARSAQGSRGIVHIARVEGTDAEPAATGRVRYETPTAAQIERSFEDILSGLQSIAARPAAPSVPAVPAHTVKRGDTLTEICRDGLMRAGKPHDRSAVYEAVGQVARANGLRNPDLIFPGQSLDLSVLGGAAPRETLAQARPAIDAVPQKAVGGPHFPAAATQGFEGARRAAFDTARFGGASAPQSVGDAARMLETVARSAPVRQAVRTGPGPRPWESVLEGKGVLTSPFGMRKDPFTGQPAFHKGIDIAAARGTDIQAFEGGEVVFSGWRGGYGNLVVLRHPNGLETRYGHAAALNVRTGDTVRAGQVIAEVGSTGRSTGNHLHFEVRVGGEAVNPLPYLKSAGERLKVAKVF